MLYNPISINSGEFINGSATATGTVLTIPANKWFSVSIQLSASATVAGAATPRVTYNTTGATAGTAFPANGSIVARLSTSGLALSSIQSDGTVDFAGYTGDHTATLDLNSGSASTVSCVINGFIQG